jgi:hypothetical protein
MSVLLCWPIQEQFTADARRNVTAKNGLPVVDWPLFWSVRGCAGKHFRLDKAQGIS